MPARKSGRRAEAHAGAPLRLPRRTPASLGYAMPAEWEPHEATLFSWPHDPVTFRDLDAVERTYATAIAALSHGERVDVLVRSAAEEKRAASLLAERGAQRVRLRRIKTADVWIRDYGPTFLVRRDGLFGERPMDAALPRRAYVRWRFNAWGEKYATLLKDDGIPDRLGLRDPRFAPPIVLEGGSIDVNGSGSVLTTEQCLLDPGRNPRLNRLEIEAYLCAYLGVTQVLWLGEGIVGDDTDGHVDDIARFVGPSRVVVAYEDDRRDANFEPLHDAWRRLLAMRRPHGTSLDVIRLPMPGPLYAGKRRLPASYANFLVGNRVVLLPTYGPKKRDEQAARILRRCFPGRAVVPIDCREMVYGYGSLHCASQQVPAVVTRLRCVDAALGDLTEGKVYRVLAIDDAWVKVRDDRGKTFPQLRDQFEAVLDDV